MRRSAASNVIAYRKPIVQRDEVERLFADYREPVYRFLRRMLRGDQAAEDLTQETFLRALRATYRADGRERAWIFQIARNLARDHARAGAMRPEVVAADDGHAVGEATQPLALALEIALSRLADEDREVLLLRETAGLSYSEIADACGLTPDAVRSRLHRTRLALRCTLPAPAHHR